MPSDVSRKILIVAAEASSCLYAQRLLEYWKKHNISVEAFGVGDRAMEALGFECLARAEDMAVVGIQEVLGHFWEIRAAFHKILAEVKARQPQVVLLLDYPGFNLRLAKKLKAMGIPVVYYISPQIWAWKQGRVHLIREVIDRMLVVFPFEVDFYSRFDVKVDFVGHPLLDELSGERFSQATRNRHRARYGILPSDIVLGLMPGSRRSELNAHLQVQLAAAEVLHKRHSHLKIVLLVAPNFSLEDMQPYLSNLKLPLILIKDEPFSMINFTDVVLCASGTATLMVGLLEKAMVIMYRMNAITAWLAKRIVRHTKYFGLINLVLDERVVPELFQEQAAAEKLVEALEPMLTDENERKRLAQALRPAKDRLGSQGATVRVAEILAQYWGRA